MRSEIQSKLQMMILEIITKKILINSAYLKKSKLNILPIPRTVLTLMMLQIQKSLITIITTYQNLLPEKGYKSHSN